MSFGIKIEADLIEPSYEDASIPLKQIGDAIVRDIQKNMRAQIDIKGKPYAPLTKKTIAAKKKAKSKTPTKALIRKGVMLNAVHAYKSTKNNVEVRVISRGIPRRDFVGNIHQNEGVNKHSKTIRRFLGMSNEMVKKTRDRFARWVKSQGIKSKKKHLRITQ